MLDWRYYKDIFFRRLPYFLVVVFLFSTASVIVAMTLPPSYIARMTLIVESPRIPDELAASTAQTPAQEQLQIVEQRLLTRSNLLDIANRIDLFADQGGLTPGEIVQAMRQRTNISSGGRATAVPIMQISFEAKTGEQAAGVLNEYLTIIQKEDVESRTGRATQTLEFFEQEVARLSERLAENSSRILAFKTENADALPDSLDYRLNRRTLLQERLAQQEREIASLGEQRARLIEVFESTGQIFETAQRELSEDEQQLRDLRRELREALVIYSPKNPRVEVLEARVAQLEEVVSSQPQQPVQNTQSGNLVLDGQLAELDAKVAFLKEQRLETEAALDELNDSINRTPANAIMLDELELDYENTQLQYNTAVDRLSRASTGERIEVMARGQRISVIEPPVVPDQPAKPNRKLIAVGGGMTGVLAGLGLVMLLELLDRSIRRPEDLVSKLGIAPLATIPYLQTPAETLRLGGMRLARVLLILVGVPAVLYAVHTQYIPLEIAVEKVLERVGIR